MYKPVHFSKEFLLFWRKTMYIYSLLPSISNYTGLAAKSTLDPTHIHFIR